MGALETQLVVADLRALVSLPDNDFSWSGWTDASDALAEIDAAERAIAATGSARSLDIVFAPTGPLQELSMSSGWANAFLALANFFDRARGDDCTCLTPPFDASRFVRTAIGVDTTAGRFADVSHDVCSVCKRAYVHYAWELEGVSRSGRWFRAPLMLVAPQLSASNAVEALSRAPFHYVGGSYFESVGVLRSRPLDANAEALDARIAHD